MKAHVSGAPHERCLWLERHVKLPLWSPCPSATHWHWALLAPLPRLGNAGMLLVEPADHGLDTAMDLTAEA